MMLIFLSVVLVTVGGVLRVTAATFCPDINVMENLDLAKLKGLWWIWEGSGTQAYTDCHSCHASNFYPLPGGTKIAVINDYVFWTNELEHARNRWNISDDDPAPDGKLSISIKLRMQGVQKASFLVLDTDYERYLVVHMCKDASHYLHRFQSSLTFTRKTSYTEAEIKDIDSKVEAALDRSQQTRKSLGLFHTDLTVNAQCETPEFPPSIHPDLATDVPAPTQVKGVVWAARRLMDKTTLLAQAANNPKIDQASFLALCSAHLRELHAMANRPRGVADDASG